MLKSLGYLSNFWRFLDLLLINDDLSWTKYCVFSEHRNRITGATFQINNDKLYIPVVILSINDIKFLENIKQGFKIKISWNKYRSNNNTTQKQ